ncbi:hypothetical protein DR864_01555 [Runella rosea]|uniref:Sulfatase-modifying factor enzyme-like domain-containing protein n=1 Tax=Runella rosea TaxID=2259595 RepID=A0A344TCY5_9BACT|nr:formylglycine-generating enzyme family protein [Runella rosea]AXE16506.1 hypothetical protein DR864_01555 [Runella rosea]
MKKIILCFSFLFWMGCKWEEPSLDPLMVLVEGGSFTMGRISTDREIETYKQSMLKMDDELPIHTVTLNSFYICKYEVTVKQYRDFCEDTGHAKPVGIEADPEDNPVRNVTWRDAVDYCEWLSDKTGKPYRLPTEAEWEYAARGGKSLRTTSYAGSSILTSVGWYDGNSRSGPQNVGKLSRNSLGLYDMSGNVWEWCRDWYAPYTNTAQTNPSGPEKQTPGTVRSHRGGSFMYGSIFCRVTYRGGPIFGDDLKTLNPDTFTNNTIGFRLVADVE